MRIVSNRAIREFARKHDQSLAPLNYWLHIAKAADWRSPADVRRDLNGVDFVGDLVVFDIGGNKFRLIAIVNYRTHIVFIRHILTHKEYDKGAWKT